LFIVEKYSAERKENQEKKSKKLQENQEMPEIGRMRCQKKPHRL